MPPNETQEEPEPFVENYKQNALALLKENLFFKSATLDTPFISTQIRDVPNEPFFELNSNVIRKNAFMLLLPNQIFLEINDTIAEKEPERYKDLNTELIESFKKNNHQFWSVSSGGKSIHHHLFYHPSLFANLVRNIKDEMTDKTGDVNNIKFMSIEKPEQKYKALRYFLAKVYITKYLPTHFIEDFENMWDEGLFSTYHTFPLPNRYRNDKKAMTKLIDYNQKIYPTLDKENLESATNELYEAISQHARTKGDDKNIIELKQIAESEYTNQTKEKVQKELQEMTKIGARKGKRDTSSFIFFMKLLRFGYDIPTSQNILKDYLMNSDPIGQWDNEKEVILKKGNKYWLDKYENSYQSRSKPRITEIKKIQQGNDKEMMKTITEKFMSQFGAWFTHLDSYLVKIVNVVDVKDKDCAFIVFSTSNGTLYYHPLLSMGAAYKSVDVILDGLMRALSFKSTNPKYNEAKMDALYFRDMYIFVNSHPFVLKDVDFKVQYGDYMRNILVETETPLEFVTPFIINIVASQFNLMEDLDKAIVDLKDLKEIRLSNDEITSLAKRLEMKTIAFKQVLNKILRLHEFTGGVMIDDPSFIETIKEGAIKRIEENIKFDKELDTPTKVENKTDKKPERSDYTD